MLDVAGSIIRDKLTNKMDQNPRKSVSILGKMAHRRCRTPNWSLDEKQCLLDLIKERKQVVIVKNNNGPNHSDGKDNAWNDILRELETRFGPKFSRSSLKKVKTQWQNMKRIAREEITANGPFLHKYSKQSLEVCKILNLINEVADKTATTVVSCLETRPTPSLAANIEIKTETIDEVLENEIFEPINNANNVIVNNLQNEPKPTTSTTSEHSSDVSNDPGQNSNTPMNKNLVTGNPFIRSNFVEEFPNVNPFHRDLNDYYRYTAIEKQLKLETLREERQIVKTMKETAAINKIIAEQRLKHLLWVKQKQMA
ncbi:hypothetical protein EVAR_8241_1 [Eumeta japonica]|uniref:Regulatory protein zeste n=1 Tax=Eumeta variegata TaxID=151549 RepID=A0A4C1TIV6_EUMVA|nr:hypothetical protein EVAR_8241_1 [Eumeta japonica]